MMASLTRSSAEAPLLYRFLKGQDSSPAPMSGDEVGALGDVFSRDLLLRGSVPLTLRALDRAIAAMPAPGLPVRKMFLVAEGAQFVAAGKAFEPNARLVFTWQASSSRPPDILVSTVAVANDQASLLQLIAWSEAGQAFHFFERKNGAWVWAGNSFHALRPPTRGEGPFDSHINGGLVMKELKAPWSHWHSMSGSIGRNLFGAESEFNTDPLFAHLEGAQLLENIVKAGISRWTRARLRHDLAGATLDNLTDYMRQLLWCTSVNLVSSSQGFGSTDAELNLPTSFFFDAEAIEYAGSALDLLAEIIPARRLQVDAAAYRAALAERGIGVVDDSGQDRRVDGDTHFAFLVPERAFEDQAVLIELISKSVLSARLALTLLLVDFSNPVFSPRRAALLRHVPASIAVGSEGAALDGAFVDSVRAAAAAADSPEAEFLALWDDSDLLGRAAALLGSFHAALEARLRTPEGIGDLIDLAESRREVVRRTRSLAEFKSGMAQGIAPRAHLAMRPDGSIFVKPTDFGEGEF